MNKFLFFICILIPTSILAQDANWKNLSKKGYSISHPANWTVDTSGTMGTTFSIKSGLEANDDFQENINLVLQDLSAYDGLDLNRYVEISLGQIKNMIKDGDLKSNERKGDFQEMVYLFQQGKNHLTVKQRLWVKNQKAYVLTFTAKADAYEKYLKTAEKIMKSFTIK
ncbi:MAG: hypothetical protein OIF50_00200 [Flavobacteriaceae bacterium]|nr:hypothetical protein [Flavobacteriaceae bacterium]